MDAKDIRWKQRFKNFETDISNLQEAVHKKDLSDLEKAGVIKFYEFTFELAWKTVKDYLEEKDIEVFEKLIEKYIIDLIIKGKNCKLETALNISAIINERLPIPYHVNVINYATLHHKELKEHIDRVGILFFSQSH